MISTKIKRDSTATDGSEEVFNQLFSLQYAGVYELAYEKKPQSLRQRKFTIVDEHLENIDSISQKLAICTKKGGVNKETDKKQLCCS